MPLVERDLDVAVRFTDGPGIVVDGVDRGEIGANVVGDRRRLGRRYRAAYHFLYLGKASRGLLDPGSDRHPYVHQNLSTVYLGEEIATEERRQKEGQHHD